ncbi:hypothetical protein CEUSTIGMA_g4029.t1 [Chlamydomonas eustigma]|uniref:J domain-containing protein n=1 Tax=Chlamydomonas eustigma TaxID=1157962 RepID=A0A250X0H8_9CHLO|nr:hypothetical protein CEUSTIGMA_g4029.t1 [Chlamydomonas eustigma]|eukprot:GAX76583.1 hypothetical protein CEUSTIGMA_g4029.t1 [Chlamydomonas eustigma]
MGEHHTGSSSLFGIFILTIYSLVVIPYTISYFCCGDEEAKAQPWSEKSKKKKSSISDSLKRYFTKGNLLILVLWTIWFILLWAVSSSMTDMKPFDPFEILEIERGSTDKEIKRAYRQLSLKYHPDKNPDLKANKYFSEFITKAYEALTDEVSRQNFEKYGHPDGPQAMNIGIALPEWIFPTDKKAAPLVLLGLVGCGILLPLIGVSVYMMNTNKFTGPNQIMQETLAFYFNSKFSIKESQSLVRIPETLVCAMEFLTLKTPGEHIPAIDDLRKVVQRSNTEVKDKPLFMKRKASIVKVHLLLLAYLDREENAIPSVLQPDLKFLLQKAPILLEEMLKIAAVVPRAPHGYGWLTPAIAVVEMMQCMSQALSISIRKPASAKPSELAAAAIMQLPHVDAEVVKKLKRRKVNTLKELSDLSLEERSEALLISGLTASQVEAACTLLEALPTIGVRAKCGVEGEDEILEADPVKCKVRVVLTRLVHTSTDFEPPVSGKVVRACTPLFPHPREENWHFFLTDPATNSVLGYTKASLAEAEAFGFDHPQAMEGWSTATVPASSTHDKDATVANSADDKEEASSKSSVLVTASKFIKQYNAAGKTHKAGAGGELVVGKPFDPEEAGQEVEFMFLAPPKAGKYDLQLVVMSDCYIGCDRTVALRLKVNPLTKAVMELREQKQNKAAAAKWESDDDDDDESKTGEKDDSEDEESEGDDYDSDETGELETGDEGSDIEEDVNKKNDGLKEDLSNAESNVVTE